MRITLDISPSQANNLPLPLREEVLQAAARKMPREMARISREKDALMQRMSYMNQQERQLGEWEELLG